MNPLKFPIRPSDLLLIVLSCAIIFVVALTSLFERSGPGAYLKRDCELFYRNESADAVQNCIVETRTAPAPPRQ
jgi:hypothetical protein